MKCSIALTTYNGMAYIEELLDSIVSQTLQPDEIVIVDDCSSDNTLDFVKVYSHNHPEIVWNIQRNDVNLGWKKNFRKAINLCTNEVIFLADQDDIWYPFKMQEMSNIIMSNDDIGVLVGNYEPKYESDTVDKVRRKKKPANDGAVVKISFEEHIIQNIRPGCVYCFKKSFYEQSLKTFDNSKFPHDAMLFSAAILYDALYLYNRVIMQYRRHGHNTYSNGGVTCAHLISELSERIELADWMLDKFPPEVLSANRRTLLIKYKNIQKKRIDNINARNFKGMVITMLKNRRFYSGLREKVLDLYVCLLR